MANAASKASVATLTQILEAGDRPHAATALGNVDAIAEIHAVEGLAPFVEGFCHYLAHGKGQGALDGLRSKNKPLYVALRNKLILAAGVQRVSNRTSVVNEESMGAVAAFLAE